MRCVWRRYGSDNGLLTGVGTVVESVLSRERDHTEWLFCSAQFLRNPKTEITARVFICPPEEPAEDTAQMRPSISPQFSACFSSAANSCLQMPTDFPRSGGFIERRQATSCLTATERYGSLSAAHAHHLMEPHAWDLSG